MKFRVCSREREREWDAKAGMLAVTSAVVVVVVEDTHQSEF